MTRPTMLFFGQDGPPGQGAEGKIVLRTLLYGTAKRAQIIENMYVTVRRGESVQTFNIWAYADNGQPVRGGGLRVSEDGVAAYHHFVLPNGTQYVFLEGEYIVEVYATLVNSAHSLLLSRTHLELTDEQAVAIARHIGVYFNWGPLSKRYHAHVDSRPFDLEGCPPYRRMS